MSERKRSHQAKTVSERDTEGHRERKNYRQVVAEEREKIMDTFGRNCDIYENDEI